MKDSGHEGPSFTKKQIRDLAQKVYERWAEVLRLRDRWAKPRTWKQLFRIERSLWILEVHGVMLGGEPANSREPWERTLITTTVKEAE